MPTVSVLLALCAFFTSCLSAHCGWEALREGAGPRWSEGVASFEPADPVLAEAGWMGATLSYSERASEPRRKAIFWAVICAVLSLSSVLLGIIGILTDVC